MLLVSALEAVVREFSWGDWVVAGVVLVVLLVGQWAAIEALIAIRERRSKPRPRREPFGGPKYRRARQTAAEKRVRFR